MLNYIIDNIKNSFKNTIDIYKDDVLYIIKNFEYNMGVAYNFIINNVLMSDVLVQYYDKFSLMESLLLIDGIICSIYFLRDFLILKLSLKKLSKKTVIMSHEEIVNKYNKLYRLSTIDRYLFYLIIYFNYNVINYFYDENRYNYIFILLITLPYVQNSLLSIGYIGKFVGKYLNNKHIFMKYSFSKMTIHFIQHLHPQIEKIQNYHIFILYKLLSVKFIWTIITNCLFILLLNILRSYDSTYYYYKGIKMAYYYKVGYLYNIIPIQDAIYLVNIIIKEKRWNELEKMEVLNAFFILVINKYELFNSLSGTFSTNLQLVLLQISSLYSIISVFKIINIYISGVSLCITLITLSGYLIKFNIKNMITSILLYFLIIFNINDLIITCVIITHKVVYYWLEEIFFFIKNIENLKKVIRIYDSNIPISKVKEEYVVI